MRTAWIVVAIGALGCAVGEPAGDGFTSFDSLGNPTTGPVSMTDTLDPTTTTADPSATSAPGSGGMEESTSGADTATSAPPPLDTGCVPAQEVCNGVDDDCNGDIDEDDPMLGEACNTGMPGACSAGTQVCDGGGLVCDPDAVAMPETCNGVDDDCNGEADDGNPEGGGACSTGLPGICAAGTETCTMGALDCVQDQPAAGNDVCGNGLDDDCDGTIDDGCLNCQDIDLGSAVPQSVNGSNAGGNDSFAASCGAGGGADTLYRFTAAAAGIRTFDTFGSGFDTVLVAYSDCAGTEITCNDDTGGLQSQITVNLAAGQGVIIAVDGYNGATGAFTLNVN